MKRFRYLKFIVIAIITLALSTVNTIPVLADDETPPPTVTEASVIVESLVVPSEEPTQEEILSTESNSFVQPDISHISMDLVEEGKPLANTKTTQTEIKNDPIWCPVGVAVPADNKSGCSPYFSDLTGLLNWLQVNDPNMAGTIWIQKDYDSSTAIGDSAVTGFTLDGGVNKLDTMANFSLTIKGGWNGCTFIPVTTCVGTIDVNDKSVFNGDYLHITAWNGDITLSDILITGTTSGTSALDIQTTKNVTLINVDSNNNGAGITGININNADGSLISTVSITNSNANNNSNTGINILSDGVVTLKDISANHNVGNGITVNNTVGTSVVGISFTGLTIASSNSGFGVYATSRGVISSSSLVANSNGSAGVRLDNLSAVTALGITLSGVSNQFKFNGSDGLQINSNGAITLSNINANNNASMGAILHNESFLNGVAPVTLSGFNSFNENGKSGIEVYSDGIVTLNNVTANLNGIGGVSGYGLKIDNHLATTPKAVILSGVNELKSNFQDGIYIWSAGAITTSNLTSSFNGNFGANFVNNLNSTVPQNVTINGYAKLNSNFSGGLRVNTFGAVSLANITANLNFGDGANIDNQTGSTLVRNVSITGVNFFNENSGSNVNGLYIQSLGTVTLNNISASYNVNGYGVYVKNNFTLATNTSGITLNGNSEVSHNGKDGIYFEGKGNIVIANVDATDNSSTPGFGVGINITNVAGTGNVSVGTSLAGWLNDVSNNYYSGIEIRTNGVVTLSNIVANFNGNSSNVSDPHGWGVKIINDTASLPKSVTLLGTNEFLSNYNDGLYILTDGAVVLNKITSATNGGYGAFVDNRGTPHTPAVPQIVTISGYGNFHDNPFTGLRIQAYGQVTLTNITASANGGGGVYVDLCDFSVNCVTSSLKKGVTINTGVNVSNNTGVGLEIHTLGAIVLNNLTADNNTSYGALLDNNESGALSGVTINGHAWSNNNQNTGLEVDSLGSITIANLLTSENLNYGARLTNNHATSVGSITLSGYAKAVHNSADGILLFSNRAITVTNFYSYNNSGAGVIINNTSSTDVLPQNVTINGTNVFSLNGDDGLDVITFGSITTNNITASQNGQNVGSTGYGLLLDNASGATLARGITLNGVNIFEDNFVDGLYAQSLGLIKGNSLGANNNGGNGVYLDNNFSFGSLGVTLTGNNLFEGNAGLGLSISSNGAVTLNNILANNNYSDGVDIFAYNATLPSKLTMTGTNTFNGNAGMGLSVDVDGAITLNNISANGNTLNGAYLNNYSGVAGTSSSATLKLTGNNTFSNNLNTGLYFETNGLADISHITADNNDSTNLSNGSGVDGFSANAGINVVCGSMTNNGVFGWRFGATTIISLKGVFSFGNGNVSEVNKLSGILVESRACP
ncbi:MAG: hypothetical protein U0Z26_00760 [Anaerolineales bacterium]